MSYDGQETQNPRKGPGADGDAAVLLIQREENGRLFTEEVLRRAGFQVHAVAPAALASMNGELENSYPLVILNNTLGAREASRLGMELRRRSPDSKLLLLLGPNSRSVRVSLFDAVMEGLDGPEMLIRTARALMNGGMNGKAADQSA